MQVEQPLQDLRADLRPLPLPAAAAIAAAVALDAAPAAALVAAAAALARGYAEVDPRVGRGGVPRGASGRSLRRPAAAFTGRLVPTGRACNELCAHMHAVTHKSTLLPP